MAFESVEVNARWKHDGKFEPTQFSWKKKHYRVESTGRDWEDDEGFHVLCMVDGGQVFELVFKLNPAGWFLKPPANMPKAV
jgi:hypothetical protein